MSNWVKLLIFIILIGYGCGDNLSKNFYYIGDIEYNKNNIIEYNIWVDKNFGEMDRIEIDEGIRQWNYALNGSIILVVRSYEFDMEVGELENIIKDGGWLIFKIDSNNEMVKARERVGIEFKTLAWVNSIGGNRIWMIRDRIRNEWVDGLIMHEIGHLLGAKHEDGLMNPYYDMEDYNCIDYNTMKKVAEYQHIEMKRLKYCIK